MGMFEIGSYVMYGNHGVCTVAELREEDFSGESRKYYILEPRDERAMTIYVPADALELVAQMRPLLTVEEIEALIASLQQESTTEWIADPKARAEHFSRVLREGDRQRMLNMLRQIWCRRRAQAAIGKKLYQADEHAFAKAERLLYGEFAVVLGIEHDQVIDYIREKVATSEVGA
jgi:CarD family transcriptional regulator